MNFSDSIKIKKLIFIEEKEASIVMKIIKNLNN